MELNQVQFETLVSTVCDRVENSVKERDRKWLTLEQVADILQVSKDTVRRHQASWKLQIKAVTSNRYLYKRDSLDRFLERGR
jgi:excisionase family DNA binding protein